MYRNEKLTKEVTNSIDGVCEIEFFKVGPSNAVILDEITGQVPPGHELHGQQINQVQPVGHIQKLLLGKVNAGDYGDWH